jgi:hypothetical protein
MSDTAAHEASMEISRLAAENAKLRAELAGANLWLHEARLERDRLRMDYACLKALVDTPRADEFFASVKNEAAHQIARWGTEHDAGKADSDWFWLVGFLAGKAMHNVRDKKAHHIIATAAALLNWYRAITGESNAMRAGIESPTEVTP